MGMEAGVAYVSILPSAKGFGRELNKQIGAETAGAGDDAGKAAGNNFGKKMLQTVGGLAIGAAVGKFISDSIAGASDFSEVSNKINVVFGSAAGSVMQWSSTAATSLGMSQRAALDAAAGFGTMFTQLGFSGAAAQTMSQGMVGLSADLASFHNLQGGAAEASDMLSAAMRGEYDSLQRVIPTINAAAVEQRALADTGKTSAKELTAAEKAAAVYALAMEGAGPAVGDFAATSDGLANQQRILSAQWQDLSDKMGTAFLPVVASVATFLNSTLVPALSGVWDWLGQIPAKLEAWKTPITAVAGVIGAVLLPMFAALGVAAMSSAATATTAWVIQSTQAMVNAVKAVAYMTLMGVEYIKMGAKAIAGAAQTVAGWVMQGAAAAASWAAQLPVFVAQAAKWVWSGAQALAGAAMQVAAWVMQKAPMAVSIALAVAAFAVMVAGWAASAIAAMAGAVIVAAAWLIALGPVGLIIAAIVAVVAIFVLLWTKCEWFRDFWIALWDIIVNALKAAWEWIVAAVTAYIGFFVGIYVWLWNTIVGIWNALWDAVKAAFQAVWNWLKAAVEAVKAFFQAAWTWIKDTVTGAWNALWNAVKAVFDTWWNGLKANIEAIKSVVSAAWNWIKDTVTGVWDALWGFVTTAFNTWWNGLKANIETIKSAISGAWTWIKDTVTGVWDALWGFVTTAFNTWWNGIKGTIDTVKGAIIGAFQTVKDTLTGIWDGITGMIRGAVDTISGIGQGLWNGLKGAINAGIRMLNTAIGGFNSLIGAVNSVPGVNIPNIPKIPQLADGGVVTRPTLALVGEAGPEAVVPLDRWESRGGGGPTQVRVFIGERELTEMIRVEVVEANSASARLLAAGRRP